MASNENSDFYVTFGSNAKAWAEGLTAQLAPADLEIKRFFKNLKALEARGEAVASGLQTKLAAGDPAGQGPGTPTTHGSGPDLHEIGKSFASAAAELERFQVQLGHTLRRLNQTAEGFVKERQAQNRTAGAQGKDVSRDPLAASSGRVDRNGRPLNPGQFASSSNPNAVIENAATRAIQRSGGKATLLGAPDHQLTAAIARLAAVKPPSIATAPTALTVPALSIADTSRSLIGEAAFQRVVDAVERGTTRSVKAINKVEQAIQRLSESNGSQGSRRGGKRRTEADAVRDGGPVASGPGVDPTVDAAFTRANQLRKQIADRQRLTALNAAQAHMTAGTAVPDAVLKTASAGSHKTANAIRGGDTDRIQKAIDSVKAQLADVPKLRALQTALTRAIADTGTEDGIRTGVYRPTAANRAANRAANLAASQAQIAELPKPLKRETRAANRAVAEQARAPGGINELTAEERAQTRSDLLRGGGTAAELEKRNTKADLQRIARSHSSQGYDVDFTKKTTKPQLAERITAANKLYEDAGQATYHNLATTGTKVATSISKGTASLLTPIVRAMAEMGAAQKAALDTILLNAKGGGTSVATQNRQGQARTPDHPIRGSAFGGAKDQQVTDAEAVMKAFYQRIGSESKQAAFKTVQGILAKNPNYNFYDKKLDAGIQGGDDKAKQAREALGKLRSAATALDAGQQGAIQSPEARAALETRQARQRAFADAQAVSREANYQKGQGKSDLRDGAFQALFGSGTGLGSGQTNAFLTRLLPGVTKNRTGDLRPTAGSRLTPQDMQPLTDAFRSFSRAIVDQGVRQRDIKAGTAATPEQQAGLDAGATLIATRKSRLLDAYDQVHRDKALSDLQAAQLSKDTKLSKSKYAAAQEQIRATRLPTSDRQVDILGTPTTVRDYSLAQRQHALDADKKASLGGKDDPQAALSRAQNRVTQSAQIIETLDKATRANSVSGAKALEQLSNNLVTELQKTITSALRRIKTAEAKVAELGAGGDPKLIARHQATIDSAQAAITTARDSITKILPPTAASLAGPRPEITPARAKDLSDLVAHLKASKASNPTGLSQEQLTRNLVNANRRLTTADKAVGKLDPSTDPDVRAKALERQRVATAAQTAAFAAANPITKGQYDQARQRILDRNAQETGGRLEPAQGPGGPTVQNVAALRPVAEAIHQLTQQLARDAQLKSKQSPTRPATPTGAATPPTGGGGNRTGGGAGTGGATGAGRGGWSGEDRGILGKILGQLGTIHATLKSGIKVTAAKPGTTGALDPAAAKTTTGKSGTTGAPDPSDSKGATPSTRVAANRSASRNADLSTQAGRDAFFAATDVRKVVDGKTAEAAATALVTKGILSQTRAVALYQAQLKLGDADTKKFASTVRAGVGDTGLGTGAQRAAKRAKDEAAYAERAARASQKVQDAAANAAQRGERELTHSQSGIAAVMDKVSAAARKEVDELRRLTLAGADQAKIAAQQIAAYKALDAALAANGMASTQRRNAAKAVLSDAGPKVNKTEIDNIARSANLSETGDLGGAGRKAGERFGSQMAEGSQGAFERTFFGNNGFAGRVIHTVGTFMVRNVAAGAVFGLTNALREAISQGIETESTFVRVSEALEKTGRSSSGLRTSLQGLSQEYGVALKDVYTTAAGLTGLFDSSDTDNKELLGLTRVAVQLSLISGGALNATEAMRSLASISSSYGQQSSGALDSTGKAVTDLSVTAAQVADVVTTIQNRLSVNVEDTLEGVARLSGQAKVMGLTFASTAAYVAAISKFTAQTGAGAGEQFSRILHSLQTGKTQQVVSRALSTKGVDISSAFNTRDYQSALNILLKSYGSLDAAERDRVSRQIGGARQAASVNGLLIEGAKVLDTVAAAQNSAGAADERAAAISKQLAAQMKRAHQAYINFVAILVRSGALNAVGILLHGFLITMQAVNTGLSALNDITTSNPITATVQTWGFALLGFVAIITVAKKAWIAFTVAMAAARASAGIGVASAGIGAAAAGGGAAAAAGGGAAAAAGAGAAASGALTRAQRSAIRRAERVAAARYLVADYAGTGFSGRTGRNGVPIPIRQPNFNGRVGNSIIGTGTRVDANGVPVTRAGQFYARRAVGAANAAEVLTARSLAAKAAAAEMRAVESATLRGTVAQGRYAAAMRLTAASATAGAAAMRGASAGMTFMARNAFLMNSGLLIAAAAIFLVWKGVKSLGDDKKDFNKLYDAQFRPKAKEDLPDEVINNNYKQAYEKARDKDRKIFLGTGRAIGTAGFGGVAQQFGAVVTGGLIPDYEFKQNKATTKAGDDILKLTVSGNRNLIAAGKDRGSITKSLADSDAEYKTQMEAIRNSSSISGEDKDQMISELIINQARLHSSATKRLLVLDGFSKFDAIAIDSLTALGSAVTSMVGLSTGIHARYASLIAQSADGLGLMDGSVYQTDLAALNKPGLDQQGRNQAGRTLLEHALAHAQTMIDSTVAGDGGPEDQHKQYVDQYNVLVAQLDQLEAAGLDQLTATAVALATSRRYSGDYLGAIAAGQQQLAVLAEQLAQGRITLAAYQAQSGTIEAQMAQDAITRANKKLIAAKGSTRETVALAQIALGISRNTLAELQRSPGDTTAIQAAQNRVDRAAKAIATSVGKINSTHGIPGSASRGPAIAQAEYNAAVKALADIKTNGGVVRAAQAKAAQAARELARKKAELAVIESSSYQGQFSGEAEARAGVKTAQANLIRANAALVAAKTKGGSAADIELAQLDVIDKANAVHDGIFAKRVAAMQTNIARLAPGDVTGQAVGALRVALAQQQDALSQYGADSTQYQAATQSVIATQRAITDITRQMAESNSNLAIAMASAAGDTLNTARLTAEAARRKLAEAKTKSGGIRTPAVVDAEAASITADAAQRDAPFAFADSVSNLAVALATAAGQTVVAAVLQFNAAKRKLAEARKKSGGIRTSAVIDAEAASATANAAQRDALLQDKLDAIDFNKSMGYYTSNSAIAALQAILKAANLTETQRRSIMLKIKGLQDDLKSALTGSGFNIPSQIKLPTAYEVRRSLGMDKLAKAVGASFSELTKANTLSTGSAAASISTRAGVSAGTDVVGALNAVKAAVLATGAQNVSIEQNNTISAPTAAAATAIANQVVALINQQTGQQSRANTSTPRLVTTK